MWTFIGGCEGSSGSCLANPYICASTKPTDEKARPVSTTGTLVLSVALQALNLGSCQWRCNAMLHYNERFQHFFHNHKALEAQLYLLPHLCVYASNWSLLQWLLEHMRLSARNKLSQQLGQAGHQERGCWHSDWNV